MLPQKTPMLEKASSALSCVFIGKLYQDKPLLRYGLCLYNQAIQDMSKALSRKAYSDDIVYTCTLFGQIETQHCPDSLNEWFAHIDGLSAIMQIYRPKKITSPIIAAIYGQHQKIKVLLSKLMHLSETTTAWLKEPGEGLLHELIQLLTDLSRLSAAVESADFLDHEACQLLLNDCLELEKQHMNFYLKISHEFGHDSDGDPSTYARGELKTAVPATCDLFGPAYKFDTVDEANLYIFLWTSWSYVYPLVRQCQILAMADTPECLRIDNHSFENAPHHLAAFYISKAARCLPYCMQDGINSWAIFYGIFAVTQAARVYSNIRDLERFLSAQDVMEYCALLGFDRAARLRVIWWNYWHKTNKHDFYRLLNNRELAKEYQVPLHRKVEGSECDLAKTSSLVFNNQFAEIPYTHYYD